MKKVFITTAIALTISSGAKSVNYSKYEIDEKKIEKIVLETKELSSNEVVQYLESTSKIKVSATEQTRGGYLLRAFFCGGIALHRYYMGTNHSAMWAMYFCIPVVGGVTACVDFWGAVFDKDFYLKYKNNDKYIVWLD